MKKIITVLAIALAASTFAASPAATQAWTTQFVSSLLVSSNGVYRISVGTNTIVVLPFERVDTYALSVTNSVHATITNGAFFAAIGGGVYTNAALSARISSTTTNLVWNGIGSHTNSLGVAMFDDQFGVVGRWITASMAKEIIGGDK